MRVIHVSSSMSRAGGGVSESVRLLSKVLGSADGFDARVFALEDDRSAEDLPAWNGAPVSIYPVWPPRRFAFSSALHAALVAAKPDLVHVHGLWMGHCLAVHLWSRLTKIPYIVTPHGMLHPWILRRSRRMKAAVGYAFQDAFLRRAAGFHVLTQAERDDVAPFSNSRHLAVIPNYVEPFAADATQPTWWRDEFAGKCVFLFFGRIHEKKGCLELCEAWDRLCIQRPEFKAGSVMVFCGWNDGLTGFENAVEALRQAHGNALFAGPQYGAEKVRTISHGNFFVLPSKSEGLPMAVIEAWSAGLPCLLTPECNLPIGFSEGAALQIEQNVDGIASGLYSAFRLEPKARTALSESARRLAKSHFSVETVRTNFATLYRSVIKRPACSRRNDGDRA